MSVILYTVATGGHTFHTVPLQLKLDTLKLYSLPIPNCISFHSDRTLMKTYIYIYNIILWVVCPKSSCFHSDRALVILCTATACTVSTATESCHITPLTTICEIYVIRKLSIWSSCCGLAVTKKIGLQKDGDGEAAVLHYSHPLLDRPGSLLVWWKWHLVYLQPNWYSWRSWPRRA